MFLGEHEYRLDPQGRVSVPPRFRPAFRGGLVATRGYDRCIVLFTLEEWGRFSSNIVAMSIRRQRHRKLARATFAGAFDLELDRQGRVLIPIRLRHYADIQEEVVVVGAGSYVEVWDRQTWVQEMSFIEESAWHIAETTE